MSKLSERKARPNSSYWLKRADKKFMAQFHNQPCEVCGNTTGTVGHHVVSKSRSKALRYDTRNIIIVCPMHHLYGNDLAPHSTNQLAVERFIEWFKENKPEQYKWIKDNERIERRYTYKDAYHNICEGKDAWNPVDI